MTSNPANNHLLDLTNLRQLFLLGKFSDVINDLDLLLVAFNFFVELRYISYNLFEI